MNKVFMKFLQLGCFVLLLVFTQNLSAQKAFGYDIPKKIGFDVLKGSWEMKESRDLKIFKSDKLSFNGLHGDCYLKSVWTFETDSAGYVEIAASKKCPEAKIMKLSYQLFESQTGFGPSYKLGVTFENGYQEMMYIGDWDGKGKIKLGYKDKSIDVYIIYVTKKKK